MEKLFKSTGPGNSNVQLEAGMKLMAEYSEKVAAAQVSLNICILHLVFEQRILVMCATRL